MKAANPTMGVATGLARAPQDAPGSMMHGALHFGVAAQNVTVPDNTGAEGRLWTGQGARNDSIRRVNFHLRTLWLRGYCVPRRMCDDILA